MKRYGKQRSSRVAWDEANINFLEATKTPKRKITEPKTPYHAPDGFISPFARESALDDAEHAQAVWDALSDVASSSGEASTSRRQDWASDEDEDRDDSSYFEYGLGQNSHSSKFAEQRKAHYNEYRMIKSLRVEDLVVNDADEDDEMQINREEDMIIDGIDSVHLHDEISTSGCSKFDPGKKPHN